MKVIIVEDELPQAHQLKQLLADIEPSFEIAGLLQTVSESVHFLKTSKVDLVFLDIHLADGLCFKIFDQLTVSCPVIFTTAYDKYAIEAFKHNGIAYLLKPVIKEELARSIAWYKSVTSLSVDYSLLLQSLKLAASNMVNYKKRFMCQLGKKLKIVTTNDIAYLYALSGCVFIRTHKNENFLIDQTLESIEKEVDPYEFFRLNRKIIAHYSAIKEMYPFSKSRLKIALRPVFEEDIIVSYQNVKDFMHWIKK